MNIKKHYLYLLISLIGLTGIVINAFVNPFIGYDDYYTLALVKLSFLDMINATASNVHPPLYYIILKVFTLLLNPSNNFDYILVGKIVSVIPLAILLAVTWTKVKKDYGSVVPSIFSILIVFSFQIMFYSSLIRMYTWALLFITLQLIYARDILENKTNYKSWIIFTLMSICSSYTHYFSAISSIIIYLILLVYFIVNNKSKIKIWIVSAIVCIIAYLPWINILISQIDSVKTNYWIQPIGLSNLVDYFMFIFSPMDNNLGAFLAIIFFITLLVVMYLSFKNKIFKGAEKVYVFLVISTIFLTIIAGIVLSLLIRPIFVERYMFSCFGGLLLGFSICLSKFKNDKTLFNVLIAIVVIISIASIFGFICQSESLSVESANNTEFLNSINQNDNLIICNDPLSQLRYDSYLDNATVIFEMDSNKIIGVEHNNQNLIFFDKFGFLKNNSDFDEIGSIYQDTVYLYNI